MSPTEFAAWWGAVIASLVLIWDIFKWQRSGARLQVDVTPNMMELRGREPQPDDPAYVMVKARNVGTMKTTITQCVGFAYNSPVQKLLGRRQKQAFIISHPEPGKIPHVLEPGEEWTGLAKQEPEIERLARNGALYLGVCHSCARRPVLGRLVIRRTGGETEGT